MKKIVSLCTTISIVFTMFSTFAVFADSTAADVEISTLAELEAFRDNVNAGNSYEGKTVKLTADIDMSEKYGEGKESWTPIGSFDWENPMPFSGTFDGGGHKIYNLYYYDGTEIYDENKPVGLFIYNLGTIKNLGVEGSITHMRYSVAGGIAAISDADGMIENCYFSGSITSPAHVGGITGYGNIKNCYNTGTIKGFHCVGGLTGTDSNIINCYNVGNVIKMTEEDTSLFWESECLGSISGASSSVSAMSDCFYLEGTYSVGAFAGENTDPTTALTAEQFADKLNFANWDFDMVWEMDDTLKRPVLRSNKENPPIETNMYEIKYENEKAVATVPQDGTYTVIFAAYDSGGRLLSVSAQNIPLIQGKNKPIEPKAGFHKNGTVKVLLWGGLNGMKPLCSPDEK